MHQTLTLYFDNKKLCTIDTRLVPVKVLIEAIEDTVHNEFLNRYKYFAPKEFKTLGYYAGKAEVQYLVFSTVKDKCKYSFTIKGSRKALTLFLTATELYEPIKLICSDPIKYLGDLGVRLFTNAKALSLCSGDMLFLRNENGIYCKTLEYVYPLTGSVDNFCRMLFNKYTPQKATTDIDTLYMLFEISTLPAYLSSLLSDFLFSNSNSYMVVYYFEKGKYLCCFEFIISSKEKVNTDY